MAEMDIDDFDESEYDDETLEMLRGIQSVTNDDIEAYRAGFGSLSCNLCGGSKWTVIGDKKPAALRLNAFRLSGSFTLNFGLSCDICGSTHLLSSSAIAGWVKSRDEELEHGKR